MCFHILLYISYFVVINCIPAPTHLLVTRVGPCYEPQNTIIKLSEFSVTTQSYNSNLSGMFNISENVRNGWKIKATMQKCVDIRNIDSCDFFKSFFVVKNGCSANEDEQNLYSTLFNYASPKMKCSVQAGRYELLNYPFNSKDNYVTVFESKISTSAFGYTFRLEGITVDNRKIFCAEAYLQLLYKRMHEWVDHTDVRVTTTVPSMSYEQTNNSEELH